jgi:hypothetical protein
MHNGKVLDISPIVKVQKTDDVVRVIGSTEPAVANHETTEVRNVESDKIAMRSNLTGVRTNTSVEQSIVGIQQPGVQVKDCEKIVIRTSYRGPQGPKGDTSTFNDLDIPSLKARFLTRLS